MSVRSDDNRLKWVVPALAFMVAILVVALGYVIWSTSNNWKASHQNVGDIQSYANRYIRERCIGLSVAEGVKCITDAKKTAADLKRDEADLYAQRQMAVWTFLVAVTAFVSIPMSLAGIFLVWQSLALNREALRLTADANANTLRIGQAQVGAYLTCDGGTYTINNNGLMCKPTITNHGQSAARNIKITATLKVRVDRKVDGSDTPSSVNTFTEVTRGGCQLVPADAERVGLMHFASGEIAEDVLLELRKGTTRFEVSGRLQWTDVFDKEHSIPLVLNQIRDTEPASLLREPRIRKGSLRAFHQSNKP